MSRGMLNNSDWDPYVKELPDLSRLQELVNQISSPDILSISCLDKDSYQSLFPVASVCFNDAYNTLRYGRYALSEIFAHEIWYLKKKTPPNEMAAAWFGLFYADDAALRLYAAGEHLANGIIMMLEINDEELKPYRDKGKRISQQSIVGNYLRKEKPSHPITISVIRLSESKEWRETITYRNKWVHEQPPTVKGLGNVYKRRIRWKPMPNGKGYTLQAGGGDEPEYSVDADLTPLLATLLIRVPRSLQHTPSGYFLTTSCVA